MRNFEGLKLECSLTFDREYSLVGIARPVPQQSQRTSLLLSEVKRRSQSKRDFVFIFFSLR